MMEASVNHRPVAEKIFTSQQIDPEWAANLESVRNGFVHLADTIMTLTPEGRYKSLVLTKLEEAAMFATKAFSHK
jgi:hypothetical protein